MANDFEAKHPRAKDGKFTEKLRKESGLTLELGELARGDEAEDLERGAIFVGETIKYTPGLGIGDVTRYDHKPCSEIPPGQWHLGQKTELRDGFTGLTYFRSEGIVTEVFNKDGHIEQQVFSDSKYRRLQDANKWTEKNWNKDGVLVGRSRDFFPKVRNKESFETLSKAVDEAGGSLVEYEFFYNDGVLESRRTWFKQGGQIYQEDSQYNKDGSIESTGSSGFYNYACAPENTPSFMFYQDGEVSLAEYMVERDGESVYHRTDGPAIYNRFAPDGERERYFLEGIEYTKAEWEEKVGRA